VAALVLDWDPETVIACGDVVRIPVVVSNVLDLQGFEVTVSWMTDTLRLESIDPGTAFFYDASWLTENYSNTLGESTVAAALIATNEGRSGSGVLYWLNFRSIGPGTDVPVVFTFSQLENYPNPEVSLIPHNQVNTTVTVLDRFMEGIAYLQGRSDHTGVEFYANGELLPDTTIADGSYSFCPPAGYGESFIFKAAKTGYLYSEKLVTVDVTGTIEITTVMLLGGDVIGPSITVTTEAPCDPIVTTQIPGEQDGEVNVLDLVFIGGKFDKSSTDPDWGPNPCVPTELAYRADINEDSIVNISDLVLVGSNFNGVAPAPWIYVP